MTLIRSSLLGLVAAALVVAAPAGATVGAIPTLPVHVGKPMPDLVVSAATTYSATITNVGDRNAGLFFVRISPAYRCNAIVPIPSWPEQITVVGGLAQGASVTVVFPSSARTRVIRADFSNLIRESNELNNSASVKGPGCPPAAQV